MSGASALALTGPVDGNGLYASRRLTDLRWLCVQPLTFGRAQLGLTFAAHEDLGVALNGGRGESAGSFNGGYVDVWEYDSRELAIAAIAQWDGRPTGWTRHHGSGSTGRG